MAATLSFPGPKAERFSVGPYTAALAKLTLDDTDFSSGVPLTPAQLGLSEVYAVFVDINDGYVATYDSANSVVLVFQQTDPADDGGADVPLAGIGSSDDLSDTVVTVLALGV